MSDLTNYREFIAGKRRAADRQGFEPFNLSGHLFDWQRHVVAWACRRGRAALFEDCGLGKTLQQLEWARQVLHHCGQNVIILAPLAVAGQTVREAHRFGIPCEYAPTPDEWSGCPIVVTNYERLKHWRGRLGNFAGVVLDESSILKSFMGQTRNMLTQTFRDMPYRLACTATPSPNDHMELGNHAEFLGICTSTEMLATWFINDLSDTGTWRLKRHAQKDFWRWVCSWAMCVGTPADIGFNAEGYVLPPLNEHRHVVTVDLTTDTDGALFRMPSTSAMGQHAERRRTAFDRAEELAYVVDAEPDESWIVWCDTDYEADAICDVLPDAVEVRGGDKMQDKECKLLAFTNGDARILVTKPKIAGFGLNWQHCARMAFVSSTYSFEMYYQAIRRAWRFGQKRPVDVHMFMAQTEAHVWQALQRKSRDHERMQVAMFAAAREVQIEDRKRDNYNPSKRGRLPSWLVTKDSKETAA